MPARIIRDVVHDYIHLEEDDLQFLDNQVFQRLKWVHQTNAWNVFPSMNHTRFEHSLGTMSLAVRLYDSLILTSDPHWFPREKQACWRSTTRYAALLHDVGHTPLSHVCEAFLSKAKMPGMLKGLLQNLDADYDVDPAVGSPHEFSSCIVAMQVFGRELVDLGVDIQLMCRMILGQKYHGVHTENVLISAINSSTDVDKLDYVLRDGLMSRSASSVDADRIVSAATIDRGGHLAFGPTALSVIWMLVSARNYLYMWVYTHHTVTWADYLVAESLRRIIVSDAAVGKMFDPVYIIENSLCDADVMSLLRNPKYADVIAPFSPGLFSRRYYKSVWKSYYRYYKAIVEHENRVLMLQMVSSPPMVTRLRAALGLADDDLFVLKSSLKPFGPDEAKRLRVITDTVSNESQTYDEFFNLSIFRGDGPAGMSPPTAVPWVYLNPDNAAGITIEDVLKTLNDANLDEILYGNA